MAKDVTPAPNTVSLTDEQSAMQSLKRNAGTIVSVIALALAGYFGWTYYQSHGGRVDTTATNDFAKIQASQQAIATLSEQNTDASKQQLGEKTTALQKDITSFVTAHPDSAYAWQALMLQAKLQTDNNQIAEATATLKQATQLKLNDSGLQAIATLRYAEALIANKQLEEANTALNVQLPAIFDVSKNELLGDIALAKNDKVAASDFYQKAWKAIEERNKTQSLHEDRALLRFKMEDLGLSPKMPDEPEGIVAKPTKPEAPAVAPNAEAMPTASNTSAKKDTNGMQKAVTKTPDTKTAEAKTSEIKKSDTSTSDNKADVKAATHTEKKVEKNADTTTDTKKTESK